MVGLRSCVFRGLAIWSRSGRDYLSVSRARSLHGNILFCWLYRDGARDLHNQNQNIQRKLDAYYLTINDVVILSVKCQSSVRKERSLLLTKLASDSHKTPSFHVEKLRKEIAKTIRKRIRMLVRGMRAMKMCDAQKGFEVAILQWESVRCETWRTFFARRGEHQDWPLLLCICVHVRACVGAFMCMCV